MRTWVSRHSSTSWDLSLGSEVAAAVRAAAKQQLGLTVSLGVAPNKLLAKLASRAAKPDGVAVVGRVEAVQALLAATPVERLPGEAWGEG
jgi:DNA polymerase-4